MTETPSNTPTLHHIFGMESNQYNNQYIASISDNHSSSSSDNSVIVTISGKCLITQNIQTQQRNYTYLDNPIGCVLFHKHSINKFTSRNILYAGTIDCNSPKIHVLEYSSKNMSLTKFNNHNNNGFLAGGAECGYSCLDVNSNGTLLVSVSTHPDYWLCLWDISSLFHADKNNIINGGNSNNIILQKVKASSQDIYNVYFTSSFHNRNSNKNNKSENDNKDDDTNNIITCGSGHIKFWSCTKTFTGTKLIGATGKFGKVDLMDINSCCLLPPSAKSSSLSSPYAVTSSNCSDTLLLWEGYYVKYRLVSSTRKNNNAIHCNGVYAMELLSQNNDKEGQQHSSYLLTGGGDGTIKWWSCNSILEASDQMNIGANSNFDVDVSIEPIKSLQVDGGLVHIQSFLSISSTNNFDFMSTPKHEILVHDKHGALWLVSTTSDPLDKNHDIIVDRIWDFHGGSITAMDTSPTDHLAITVDKDGCVCCWDYLYKLPLCITKYINESCSAVKWASPLPLNDSSNRTSVDNLVAVGFTNGNLRFFILNYEENNEGQQEHEMKMTLVQSMRPHEKSISCISFSSSGKYLATSSLDGTVFFFLCPKNYNITSSSRNKKIFTPIGFICCHLNNSVSYFSWCRPKTDHSILYTTIHGEVIEVDLSSSKALTSPRKQCNETYELFGIPQTHISDESNFNDVCAELLDRDRLESTNNASFYACSFAAYNAFQDRSETMIFTLIEESKKDKLCRINEISLRNTDIKNNLLNSVGLLRLIRFSWDNTILISLCMEGTVSLLFKNSPMNKCLSPLQILHKLVSQVSISFDNKHLLCSGYDGTMHVYHIENESLLSNDSGSTCDVKEIFAINVKRDETSITTGKGDKLNNHKYTLQQEILSNLDKQLRRSAENKKNIIRKLINDLRKEYSELMSINKSLLVSVQLTPDGMDVDGAYKYLASQEMEDKIKEIRNSSLQKTQECEKRRKKLQDKYLNILEHEYFVVNGMSDRHKLQSVQSFPNCKLSQHLHDAIIRIEQRSAVDQGDSIDNDNNLEHKIKDIDIVDKENSSDLIGEKCVDDPEADALFRSTYEARKVMREKRTQALMKKLNEKPSDDGTDSKVDLKLFSKGSLGMFLLKSSDEYLVPEDKQINSEIKLEEIILLKRALNSMKCNFNERLNKLRLEKCNLLQNIMDGSQKINRINENLSLLGNAVSVGLNSGKQSSENSTTSNHDVWKKLIEPSLQINSIEFPENREQFSEEDKNQYFKSIETCHSDFLQVQIPPPATSVASICYQKMNGDGKELQKDSCVEIINVNIWTDVFEMFLMNRFYTIEKSNSSQLDKNENNELKGTSISHIESDEIEEQIIKLKYERNRIFNEIHEGVNHFDMLLHKLRKERFQIATEIKLGEIKFFTLLEEFEFLTTFDGKESILRNKLDKCQSDKQEIDSSMRESFKILATKKNYLDEWIAKDKFIMDEFLSLVNISHPHYDYLHKVLFRKMKRSRSGSDNDEGDSDDESDDLEDKDFDESDEDEFDDDFDETEEACPLGCDESLYKNIILLREKRLDHEEMLSGLKKQFEELKKIHERHMIKGKQHDKDLRSVISEIQAFQNEKQQLTNALKVIIPIKIANIHIWDKGQSKGTDGKYLERLKPKVQTEMNDTLLISRKQLIKLRERIVELREDINFDKRQYIQLQKKKSMLEKEIVQINECILQGEEKCKELQLLKFGQLVDIEALDKVTVSTWEAEMEAKSKDINLAYSEKYETLSNECDLLKEQLFHATKENTSILEQIATFSERRIVIENYLDKNDECKNINKNNDFILRNESEMDISQLKKITKSKKLKIAAMKHEISSLKRKDCHVHLRV